MADPSAPLFPGPVSICHNPHTDYEFSCCIHCRQNVFEGSDPFAIWTVPQRAASTLVALPDTARTLSQTAHPVLMHLKCVSPYEIDELTNVAKTITLQPRHTDDDDQLDAVLQNHRLLVDKAARYRAEEGVEYRPAMQHTYAADAAFAFLISLSDQTEPLQARDLQQWPEEWLSYWTTSHTVLTFEVTRRVASDASITFERWEKEVQQLLKQHLGGKTRAWLHREATSNEQTIRFKLVLLHQAKPDNQWWRRAFGAQWDATEPQLRWMDLVVHDDVNSNMGAAMELYDAKAYASKTTERVLQTLLDHYSSNTSYNVRSTTTWETVPWASARFVDDNKKLGIAVNAQKFFKNDYHYFWDGRGNLLVYRGIAPGWWPIQVTQRARLEREVQLEGEHTLVAQPSLATVEVVP